MKLARLLIATMSVGLMLAGIPTMLLTGSPAGAQAGTYSKGVVGDHIRKVEDGVDQFRDYLDKRGEDAQSGAQAAQNSGAKAKRERANPANTEARKEQAQRTKDELGNALEDLNGSTNKLRRRFDRTANYMETREQMEEVMVSARRVNQVMTRGNYGTQPQRYWAPLRGYINDLARLYGLAPLGV